MHRQLPGPARTDPGWGEAQRERIQVPLYKQPEGTVYFAKFRLLSRNSPKIDPFQLKLKQTHQRNTQLNK